MTRTLPDDYARCAGACVEGMVFRDECKDCLRRTSPVSQTAAFVTFTSPPKDWPCESRIPPDEAA